MQLALHQAAQSFAQEKQLKKCISELQVENQKLKTENIGLQQAYNDKDQEVKEL